MQVYTFIGTHQIVPFRSVAFTVCKVSLNYSFEKGKSNKIASF